MKLLFLNLLLIFLFPILFSCNKDDDSPQNSEVESFDITTSSTVFKDIGGTFSIENVPTGGYILVGHIIEGTAPTNYNLQLTKLDEQCNIAWSKTFGGANTQFGDDVWPTADGGFIVSGTTQISGQELSDAYIIKTDGNGNEQWSNTFGDATSNIPESIIQTEDKGFLFVGRTGSFGIDNFDAYFVRLDEDGKEVWSKRRDNEIEDYAWQIIPSQDGHFIVLGTELENLIFPTQSLTLEKMDIDSNIIWSKTYSHKIGRGNEHGIVQDDDKGYLIATTLGDELTLSNSELLLIKVDENGDEIWNKTYGGDKNEEARTLIKTSDGNIVLLGTTSSYGQGGSDIIVVKTDGQGNEIWTKSYGGDVFYNPHGIKEMNDGSFIICAAVQGDSGQFDFDLVILKIDKMGDPM